jgi:hypothetical protein
LLPTRLLVCAAISAALAWPTSAFGWTWPVQGPVLRPFLLGDDPYAAGQHRGIDIGSPSGASVLAPAAGVVSFAGTVPVGGRTVSIQTEDGYSVTVLHLGSVAVRRGASIAEGAPIGTVGPSGEAELSVPYVYLGVRRSGEPNGYLDPLLFLPRPEAAPSSPPASGAQPASVGSTAAPAEPAEPAVGASAPDAPEAGVGGVLDAKKVDQPAPSSRTARHLPTAVRAAPVRTSVSRPGRGSRSASTADPVERAAQASPRSREHSTRSHQRASGDRRPGFPRRSSGCDGFGVGPGRCGGARPPAPPRSRCRRRVGAARLGAVPVPPPASKAFACGRGQP